MSVAFGSKERFLMGSLQYMGVMAILVKYPGPFKQFCSLTLKPLSHWTATVLRQLATDIASGSQSSLETVASDS